MKIGIQLILIFFQSLDLKGQTIIFDQNHLRAVNENALVRQISENGYLQSLDGIHRNTLDIGIHISSLSLVQTMILKSLTEVNEALKDAIQVRQLGKTTQRIYSLSEEVLEIAEKDPILLLFAEEYIRQAKERSFALLADVSGLLLSSGDNILINANVRDELITNVGMELQLIQTYMLAVRNSMYWAKTRGVLKSLNPYQTEVNQDIFLINRILNQKKLLTR